MFSTISILVCNILSNISSQTISDRIIFVLNDINYIRYVVFVI